MPRALELTSAILAVGAAYGLLGLLQLISDGAVVSPDQQLVAALAVLFFLATGAGALLVLRRARVGFIVCELALLAQVPWIEATSMSYHAMAGPYAFWIRTGVTGAPLFGVGGSFSLRFGSSAAATGLAINVAALAMLILCEIGRRRGPVSHHVESRRDRLDSEA
jgi:hypothetical protein